MVYLSHAKRRIISMTWPHTEQTDERAHYPLAGDKETARDGEKI